MGTNPEQLSRCNNRGSVKNYLLAVLRVIGLLGLASCQKHPAQLTEGKSERFTVGQVWSYKTRPSESASRLVIGRIDSIDGQNVIHIKITGLMLKNPLRPGLPQSQLNHAPISETALLNSVIAKVEDKVDLDGFQDGYDEWHSAFKRGKGGWYTESVADIPDTIEQVLAKLP